MLRLLRFAVLSALVFGAVGVAAPTASRGPHPIAADVTVAGVDVGGLMSEPARDRLRAAASRALRFQAGDERWSVPAERFGASAAVDDALARALRAPTGAELDLAVDVDRRDVRSYVARIARRYDREPVEARLAGLSGLRPVITAERPGRALRRLALERMIVRVLQSNVRDRIQVPTRTLTPHVTKADFGLVIVIDRSANSLTLYDGDTVVRRFRVATGLPQYPTPAGTWRIVVLERNPWWRPPASDWAKGLKPVPPGPGNPLGTRWMGLDASGVGIHGTPDAASLGYSRSHGCIRMAIPEAEWLFERVEIGTPVVIV